MPTRRSTRSTQSDHAFIFILLHRFQPRCLVIFMLHFSRLCVCCWVFFSLGNNLLKYITWLYGQLWWLKTWEIRRVTPVRNALVVTQNNNPVAFVNSQDKCLRIKRRRKGGKNAMYEKCTVRATYRGAATVDCWLICRETELIVSTASPGYYQS